MNSSFDIADSTDWLNTPLTAFAALENALHCQVCKEFLDTPMITSCSHTFCSKCIRTSLSADGKCPACRAPDQASKLRNNWALQEIVTMFVEARPSALEVARKGQELAQGGNGRNGKRKRVVLDTDDPAAAEGDGRTTRSKSRKIAASQESIIEADETDEDADFEPEISVDDGKVECPLGCGKRMKVDLVEPHLDRCEDERKQVNRAKSKPPLSSRRRSTSQSPGRQERISQLNYTLVKEVALRKKMDELGVPGWGSKALMERRHKEWVNIWNANCDSSQPRPKRELLADLKAWERTQGGNAPQVTNHLMKKEFDGASWASKHNEEFSRLIADAKRQQPNRHAESASAAEAKVPVETSVTSEPVNADDKTLDHDSLPGSHLRPYEGNAEALASIRRKVEAANAYRDVAPPSNEQHRTAGTDQTGCSTQDDHGGGQAGDASCQEKQSPSRHRRPSTQDEHSSNENTGIACQLPAHLAHDASAKRLPMFDVPSQAFADVGGM